jgi:NADH-quinone oxidoreductase subunit E
MEATRRYDFKHLHYVGQEGRLIPLLQQAQADDGFLTRERMLRIREETGIPLTQIYGVATFYAQFRFKPMGKNLLRVCHGTACHVSGAKDLTDEIESQLEVANGETTADGLFTLETVACLGCCSLAPVIMVNKTTHGNLTPAGVKKVLKKYRDGEKR